MLLNARRKGFNRGENNAIPKPFRVKPVVKFSSGALGMFVFRENALPHAVRSHASHARARATHAPEPPWNLAYLAQ